ncbi:MAG: hypothetical protein P8Y27_04955 [Chromatiaceae bacterium]
MQKKHVGVLGAIGAGFIALAALFRRKRHQVEPEAPEAINPPNPVPRIAKREELLEAIRGELGKTDPAPYYANALQGTASADTDWCGIFSLSMLKRVGIAPADWWWIIRKGFLFRLPPTKHPLPGDQFYMDENNHHGTVEAIRPDGMVVTLDGNSWGGAVARNVRDPSTIAGYYSIEPLLQGAA